MFRPKEGARVRTAAACRIVGLDRVKFNDVLARDEYFEPPETTKGSARLFDEDQLLRLYFFARLVDAGFRQHRANTIAYEVMGNVNRGEFDGNYENKIITIKLSEDDGRIPFDDEHIQEPHNVVLTLQFDISVIRKSIAKRLAYERDDGEVIDGSDD